MNPSEIIEEYIRDSLFPPKETWSNYEFKKRSYERSVAFFILDLIKENKVTDPKRIIKAFIDDMDKVSEDSKNSDMFILAREAAKDLYYLFC